MPKLIFSGDRLMAAAIDNPDECQRIIEALRFVVDNEEDIIVGDPGAVFAPGHTLTAGEWMAEVKEILRQFETEAPR